MFACVLADLLFLFLMKINVLVSGRWRPHVEKIRSDGAAAFFIMGLVFAGFTINALSSLLPVLKASLGVSDGWLSLCASLGLVSLGAAGLMYGIISDAYGRKPVLLFSLAMFFLGTWCLAVAHSAWSFMLGRVAQGMGAGSAWVVGNAMLKDLFQGKDYVHAMNQVHAVAGLVPALAPMWVTFMAAHWGWASCYWSLLMLALVLLLVFWRCQQETLQVPTALSLQSVRSGMAHLSASPVFCQFLLIKVVMVAMMMLLATELPLVLVCYQGLDYSALGWAMLPLFCMYIVGSCMGSVLQRRLSLSNVVMVGVLATLLASVLVLALQAMASLPLLLAMVSVAFLGWGLVFGNATAMIVSSSDRYAGLASALMICLEMLASGLSIYGTTMMMGQSLVPASWVMLCGGVCCLLTLRRVRILAYPWGFPLF
jgi:MFS transporter, DHA1 family, 2-module integral membrane pump EmrD